MNDFVKFAAIVVVAVLLLAFAIRLLVGLIFGLLLPLVLIIAIAAGAYWIFIRRGDDRG